MERYGLTTYRFGVYLIGDDAHVADDVKKLIRFANRHHIRLHPTLCVPFTFDDATDKGRYPATDAGLEMQGYNRVYPFVLRFASDISDWELQNEINMVQGVKKGVGLHPDDFDTLKGKQWAAVLRGMARAVRDAGRKTGRPLRTVIDVASLDFGLIPFLERNGVSIDELAYHYYFRMNDDPHTISRSAAGKPVEHADLFSEMRKIGKPVIINEINAAEIYDPLNRKPYDDGKALASLKKHLEYVLSQKAANIEGVEYYELYDEPGKDAAESNFGIMRDAAHPKNQMLLAAAYACGKLSDEETRKLITSGLFTESSLKLQLSSCAAGKH